MNTTTTNGGDGTLIPLSDCTLQTCNLSRSHFDYPPALPAAEAYLIYFAVFLVVQTLLGVWYKTWNLLGGVFTYLLLYILGFTAATKLSSNPFSDEWFSLYLVGLTLAPAFLTLSLQFCIERILAASNPGPLPFLPRNFLYLAIGFGCTGSFFQITGTAVMAGNSSLSASQAGADVAVVGLAIQALTLTLAGGVCVIVGLRYFGKLRDLRLLRKNGEEVSQKNNVSGGDPNRSKMFKAHVVAMIVVLLSTFVATILQADIIAGGRDGYQLRIQTLYYWQGIFMAIAVFALTICHPGFALKRSRKVAVRDAAKESA